MRDNSVFSSVQTKSSYSMARSTVSLERRCKCRDECSCGGEEQNAASLYSVVEWWRLPRPGRVTGVMAAPFGAFYSVVKCDKAIVDMTRANCHGITYCLAGLFD